MLYQQVLFQKLKQRKQSKQNSCNTKSFLDSANTWDGASKLQNLQFYIWGNQQ